MDSNSLNDYLRAVYERRDDCDVVLEAVQEDGTTKDLPCHAVFANRSGVLKSALREPYVEGSTKRVRIPVDNVKHAEALVEFLYTDCMSLDNCNYQDVIQVMVLADKYLLGGAFLCASQHLERSLKGFPVVEAQSIIEDLCRKVGHESLRGVIKALIVAVATNLTFGENVLLFLVWLVQMQETVGLPLEEEAQLCMSYVGASVVKMENEVGYLMQSSTFRNAAASSIALLAVLKWKQKGGDSAILINSILELGLFDTFAGSHRTPCRVVPDAIVEAIVDFDSDSDKPIQVKKGTRGLVVSVDEEGDASIAFDGFATPSWVCIRSFWKLRGVDVDTQAQPDTSELQSSPAAESKGEAAQ